MIMFGLLTFPSNEFDLKNMAATVVPTLLDPKRRVRQAALGKLLFTNITEAGTPLLPFRTTERIKPR
jgi:hypothetical protein